MKKKQGKAELFLGLDSSTQGCKACVLDANLCVISEAAVNFDRDLPEFKTEGGAHRHADGLTVTSPTIMWVAALDLVLERLKKSGVNFEDIVAVSGSGQQHGSVWLKSGARATLGKIGGGSSLRETLDGIFSVANSPIWMDSSTARQCAEREKAMGGAQAVAEITGSRAYERFTGNQISKIYGLDKRAYDGTERIALVSSFIASILIGDYAPIDFSDGSGMNLMDIRTRKWNAAALDCTAPGLGAKLGDPSPAHAKAGQIHQYFVEKYGFRSDCPVIVFSGDNPCSLAGLRIQKAGDIAVSLGTSDTVFGSLAEPKPSASEGHIFVNPVEPGAFMAMICYKNGSLTREKVRDSVAGGSWDRFNSMLRETEPGNVGNVGFYIVEPEITPPILKTGITRFNGRGTRVDQFAPAEEVRAVVEGQFLSMRLHGGRIGLKPTSILATGGASANKDILQVMADVFGAPVYTGEQANSASSGAAYRALHGWRCLQAGAFVPFSESMASAQAFKKSAEPSKNAHAVYDAMLQRYEALEKKVIG